MTRSTTVLLDCLRKESAETKLTRLTQYGAADWEEIVATAERHGVGPLLYHSIKGLGDDLDLPGNVMEEMRRKYYVAAARNARLYRELQKILDLFAGREIPVIVLKGAHVAETVYGNIALRTMGDVDLLVGQDDLKAVEESLLKAGAEPVECNRVITGHNAHFTYVMSDSKLTVEIHWKLISPDYPCKIDYSGIWSRAQPLRLGQTEVLALSPEDLLVYVCVHAAKHVRSLSIRTLCDIAQVASYFEGRLDWPAISACARQWGVSRALYVMLRLAGELLGAAVSEEQLAALRPAEFEEGRFLFIRQNALDRDTDVYILKASLPAADLKQIKGLRGKVLWITKRVLPPRKKMALMYPAPAESWRILLYYPMWLKDALRTYGKQAWALALGDAGTRAATERLSELTSVRDWLVSG